MAIRAALVVSAVGVLAATAGAQSSRYWVAPLIGFWDDAGNWSLTEGGPVGGGIPQNDDAVRLTSRSTCLFDGQLGLPVQSFLGVSGSGSGTTSLLQSAGLLRVSTIRVGNGTLRNDLKISGGSLNTNNLYVGEFGGEGLLEISGTGSVGPVSSFNRLFVGFSEGDGTVEINGGSANFDEVYLSIDSNLGTPGGPADLIMTDGTLDIGELYVGYGGRGLAQFTGGSATAGDCTVGFVGESGGLRPQLNVGAGGDLEINGTLTIGDFEETVGEEPGDGRVQVTGGSLTAARVNIAQDAGTDGELIVSGGTVVTSNLDLGLGGDALARVSGGALRVTGVASIGAAAAPGIVSRVEVNAGEFEPVTLHVGAAPFAEGRLVLNGGTLAGDAINIGLVGDGDVSVAGGTLDTDVLRVGGHPAAEARLFMNGGTLTPLRIEVGPSAQVFGEFEVSGGLILTQELVVEAGGEFRMSNGLSPDVRISDVVNNGELSPASSSGTPAQFLMNLTNNGALDVLTNTPFVVSGRIENGPAGQILVARNFDAGTGFLRSDSINGITNSGSVELERGVVETPNGSFTNTGTLSGFGEIHGELINNGQILPSPVPQFQSRELVVDSLQSGPASSVRVLITEDGHNSVVSLGSTTIDGTLNLAFAQGVPFPPGGTEYDLVVSPNEVIAGNFASAAILGYPCEIISGRNRVFARTLRCNIADFVPPFGVLDLSDINTFVAAFTSGNPLADINGDSFLDLADINAFVAGFTGGCP